MAGPGEYVADATEGMVRDANLEPHSARAANYREFTQLVWSVIYRVGEREFVDGFLFNRQHFHASPSAISCILWRNKQDSKDSLALHAFDIDTNGTPDTTSKIGEYA